MELSVEKILQPNITNVLSIKNILMISVADKFLGDAERFLENKICPFLRQGFCILNWMLCLAVIRLHATYKGTNHHHETFLP